MPRWTIDTHVTRHDDAPYWAAAFVWAVRAGDQPRVGKARPYTRRLGYRLNVAPVAALMARGFEPQADGGRLRLRPRAAMSPDLAKHVKRHKLELLAVMACGPKPVAEEQLKPRPVRTQHHGLEESAVVRAARYRAAWKGEAYSQGVRPAYEASGSPNLELDKPPPRLHNVNVKGGRCT